MLLLFGCEFVHIIGISTIKKGRGDDKNYTAAAAAAAAEGTLLSQQSPPQTASVQASTGGVAVSFSPFHSLLY